MNFILKPIIGIALNGGILYLLTYLVEDISYTGGLKFFVIGGVVLGLINLFIKPLIKLASMPAFILSGVLFLIVANVGVLWVLEYFLNIAQFQDVTLSFPNLGTYVIGAIVFGVINWTANIFVK